MECLDRMQNAVQYANGRVLLFSETKLGYVFCFHLGTYHCMGL